MKIYPLYLNGEFVQRPLYLVMGAFFGKSAEATPTRARSRKTGLEIEVFTMRTG